MAKRDTSTYVVRSRPHRALARHLLPNRRAIETHRQVSALAVLTRSELQNPSCPSCRRGDFEQPFSAAVIAMKIGFVVNDVTTEEAAYTTTRLAMTAVNLGHKSYTFGVGDFDLRARRLDPRPRPHHQGQELQIARQVPQGTAVRRQSRPSAICLDELDVLLLRNDPSTDATERPWAAIVRHPVRPARQPARRDGAQRSGEPGPRDQQDLLPALSRKRSARRRASAATSTRSSSSSRTSTTRS